MYMTMRHHHHHQQRQQRVSCANIHVMLYVRQDMTNLQVEVAPGAGEGEGELVSIFGDDLAAPDEDKVRIC